MWFLLRGSGNLGLSGAEFHVSRGVRATRPFDGSIYLRFEPTGGRVPKGCIRRSIYHLTGTLTSHLLRHPDSAPTTFIPTHFKPAFRSLAQHGAE